VSKPKGSSHRGFLNFLFPKSGYFYSSRTPAYGLVAVLPLLVGYELLTLLSSRESMIQVRNSAGILLKTLLEMLGVHSPFWLGVILVAAIFLALLLRERSAAPLRWPYLLAIVAESAFYAAFLGYTANYFVQVTQLAISKGGEKEVGIMLALGAGVYEELVFRALLFSTSGFTLWKVFKVTPWSAYPAAAILSSIAFSWFHYLDGAVFSFSSASFRFVAGLIFCVIYKLRGLGVAAWTHALYDLFVIG
jgi:hypothetical protein